MGLLRNALRSLRVWAATTMVAPPLSVDEMDGRIRGYIERELLRDATGIRSYIGRERVRRKFERVVKRFMHDGGYDQNKYHVTPEFGVGIRKNTIVRVAVEKNDVITRLAKLVEDVA